MEPIKLTDIDPSKKSLEFLEKRIMSDSYRGNQISQHNRYDLNELIVILKALYDISGDDKMQIRDTDLSKRPFNIAGEEDYARFVSRVNAEAGKGTQDSVRKNLLVDFARMGFVYRYNKNEVKNDPYKKQSTKYISITPQGKKLIDSSNIFEQNMLYTRGIDTIMQGMLDDLLWIVLELGKMTMEEYTFFISFVNIHFLDTFYSKDVIIELVKEYRSLSKFTRKLVVERVASYCDPDNFDGDKTDKRDYHNWVNESQQVFMLLNQTSFFEERDETIYAKTGSNAVFEDNGKLKRSISEKQAYFKYHSVSKKSGFELHHVVPLCWATSREEFDVLDNHKNLVYIDAFSHARITQNRNRNVKLDFDGDSATFTDFENNSIVCNKDENIVYNVSNQTGMKDYNDNLLNGINN